MTEKKITKREYFEAIIEAMKTGKTPVDPELVIGFCENEIGLLDKKAVKAKERAAEKKAEGSELTEIVKEALTDEYQIIADIAKAVAEIDPESTVHKVTYQLGQLVKNGVAEKTDIKIPGGEGQKTRTVKAYRLIG
jgi:hypothetical protein